MVPEIVALTLVTLVLWWLRVPVLGTSRFFPWLAWNLALAWMPYLMAVLVAIGLRSLRRARAVVFAPAVVWLAFFPNAAYLVTDLMHVGTSAEAHRWYDMLLLSALAVTGIALSIASLHTIHAAVRIATSRTVGWVFAVVVTYLAAVGVFLGRFLRWNSWDLVANPHTILADVTRVAGGSETQPWFLLFTVAFASVQLACYVAYARGRGFTTAETRESDT